MVHTLKYISEVQNQWEIKTNVWTLASPTPLNALLNIISDL